MGKNCIDIGSGVIQGGVLSPTLFLIAFNELLVDLRSMGFDVAAYADDLVITGNGMVDLKVAIDIVEKWTIKAEMKINKKKSGVLWLRKKARS